MHDALQSALLYATRPWPVFPTKPDKTPFTAHGFKDATTDPNQIRAYWRRWPDAGVAIATGSVSGVVVLDIDIDLERGINGLDALEALGVSTHPETMTSHTPRGGLHLLFKCPGIDLRNSAGKIGAHVDVRANGGYCILPPGPGRYWDPLLGLDTPLAQMPPWMARAEAPARPAQERRKPAVVRLSPYAEAALDGAVKAITGTAEGQRRTVLNRECFSIGRLAGSGTIPAGLALDALTWAGRQIPGFADHDPDKIVAVAFADGLRQPREIPNGR